MGQLLRFRASDGSFIVPKSTIIRKNLPEGVIAIIKDLPICICDGAASDGSIYGYPCWEKAEREGYFAKAIEEERAWGELDHPADRDEVYVKEVSHRVVKWHIDRDNKRIIADEIWVLDNQFGKQALSMILTGRLGISVRALGVYEKGTKNIVPESFILIAFDFVSNAGVGFCLTESIVKPAQTNQAASIQRTFFQSIADTEGEPVRRLCASYLISGDANKPKAATVTKIAKDNSEELLLYKEALRMLCQAAGVKVTDDPETAMQSVRRLRANAIIKGEGAVPERKRAVLLTVMREQSLEEEQLRASGALQESEVDAIKAARANK